MQDNLPMESQYEQKEESQEEPAKALHLAHKPANDLTPKTNAI
jgi:hypothetical protein